ncbi:MAG: alpha-2-macroglobulin, partial [Chloroflexi bacterium]
FLLYVLAEVGRVQGKPAGDLGRTVALYEVRDRLDHYGKALLALALHLQDPEGQAERVQALLTDLNNAAIVEATGAHWEEADQDWWNWNTDTRSTAIILDALARLDPENGLAPNVVRWLMVARQDGHWETTQETAWALIALTDWMVTTGELQADYAWGVQLNGRVLETGSFNRETVLDEKVLQVAVADLFRDQANRLVIEKGAGPGRLYYTAHLRAFLPVEEVQPLDRGIIVRRQYCRPPEPGQQEAGTCEPVTTAHVGDLLQVQLTLIAPHDLYYVVVEDPLPAGAEAVDTSLKTSSVVGQAPELRRVDPRDPFAGYGGWGWWWFSQTELRDEKVVLFATRLPKGTYQYTYQVQLGLAGEYRVIPPTAYEMYFPEVFGRGAGMVFTIER